MVEVTQCWSTQFWTALALVLCLTAVPAADCLAGEAVVVVLGAQTKTPYRQFVEGFKQYLSKQEPAVKFVDIPLDKEAQSTERLRDVVQQNDVALVLTLGSKALRAAVQQDVERPVIAGLTKDNSELEKDSSASGVVLDYGAETQLQWINRILPGARTVGVLYNPDKSGHRIAAAKKAAAKLGLKLIAKQVNSPKELPVAMDALFRNVDVLWGMPDPVVLSRQTAKAVLLTSFRSQVPFVAPSSVWVKAGALYALDWDYRDVGVQSGEMALSVIRGKQISAMPIQAPRKVRYSLNLRTAEHMKLKLPGKIVDGAEQVFEK
jgi:putative ABC transport system substrate-binding protein